MPPAPSLSQRVLAWPALWLVVACLACLVPFVNKAFHIDDTLFLYAAQQIREDPVNFYRFQVNWYGQAAPMWEVMQNPPLASYYIALVSALFGWSEPALHLAFLLPAAYAILGTYRLAQQLCTRPVLAALATLLTPAFLVSSTNVMCDTLTLAFWVWAVVLWERGLRRRQMALLLLSALLICYAALTKYIGVGLIPLLLAYTVARQRGRGDWLTAIVIPCVTLVIPVVVMIMYQQLTEEMYGHGLFFQAAGYAASVRHPFEGLVLEVVVSLSFVGGSVATLLFYLPLLWSRQVLLIGLAVTAVLTVGLAGPLAAGLSMSREHGIPWIAIVQLGVFVAAGTGLLALAWIDVWTRRDAASLLLALWVAGIFVFTTFLNWTCNVRSILPLLPAAGILIARRLDQRLGPARAGEVLRHGCPLLPAAVLAMLVTWADYRMAGAVRTAAANVVAACSHHPGTPWYQGHWGFQYYMDRAGVPAVDFQKFAGKAGDLVIYPGNNANVEPNFPPGPRAPFYHVDVVACRWLATMDPSVDAGFYAGIWGPLPFAFGRVQPSRYRVVELAGKTNK